MGKNILFNQREKIVLAPHYDDFVLSLAGIAKIWSKKGLHVYDCVFFSNENYLVNDVRGNKDTSKDRINVVSSIRLKEEKNALKRIAGISILIKKLDGALIRGHLQKTKKHQFPYGFSKEKDEKTFEKIYLIVKTMLSEKVQIFIPLAIREHIDHLLVRDASVKVIANTQNIKAQIFFYEDIPYAAYATQKDKKDNYFFRIKHDLIPISIPIDIEFKLGLLDFYNTQTKDSYYNGVLKRASEISKEENKNFKFERVYIKNKIN